MKTKEKLIALAINYGGDIRKVSKAYIEDEEISPIIYEQSFTIFDECYPKCFLKLKVPPLVLFYKGNLDLLKEDKIAVVGSRNPCEYSMKATKALVLNKNNNVIVSGLAKGIDACAHYYAERTIAILGCGINYIYPLENKDLYKRIEKEGLILSEYPNFVEPVRYHFPFRNRLIAALGKEVYIMEARQRSGTLTTINEAIDLGKDVKVLPFDVFHPNGFYNNLLIEEGAQMISYNDLSV